MSSLQLVVRSLPAATGGITAEEKRELVVNAKLKCPDYYYDGDKYSSVKEMLSHIRKYNSNGIIIYYYDFFVGCSVGPIV